MLTKLKGKIASLMANILKMTWKDNNSGNMIELLKEYGLQKGRKLGRWVKKGYLDGLIAQYGEEKKMGEMAYWINPCKEIDILIKFAILLPQRYLNRSLVATRPGGAGGAGGGGQSVSGGFLG